MAAERRVALEMPDRRNDLVRPPDDVPRPAVVAVEDVAVDGDRDDAHLRERLLQVVVAAEVRDRGVVVTVRNEDDGGEPGARVEWRRIAVAVRRVEDDPADGKRR